LLDRLTHAVAQGRPQSAAKIVEYFTAPLPARPKKVDLADLATIFKVGAVLTDVGLIITPGQS
jgi:hypothetical protein